MSEQDRPDKEPDDTPAIGATIAEKGRRALSRVHREIEDTDLANPAVGRMLIDEVERLERENSVLADFRDKYFSAEQQVVMLTERSKRTLAGDIIFGGCLTLSGAALGYAPIGWSHQPAGALSLVVGLGLIVIAVAAKWVQR